MIGKEVFVNTIVLEELKRIVIDSGIMKQNDKKWPDADVVGKQELEILANGKHISF